MGQGRMRESAQTQRYGCMLRMNTFFVFPSDISTLQFQTFSEIVNLIIQNLNWTGIANPV